MADLVILPEPVNPIVANSVSKLTKSGQVFFLLLFCAIGMYGMHDKGRLDTHT